MNLKSFLKSSWDVINFIKLTQDEQKEYEKVEKLENLKIKNDTEYLKSYLKIKMTDRKLFLRTLIGVIPLTFLGNYIQNPTQQIHLATIFVISFLFGSFLFVNAFSSLLLSWSIQIRCLYKVIWGIITIFQLSLIALIPTFLTFADNLENKSPKFKNIFISFKLKGNEIKDYWIVFIVIVIMLLICIWLSIRKAKILYLEKLKEPLNIISYMLAFTTYVVGISFDEVSALGQFLLYLLIETIAFSIFIDHKLKRSQREATEIFSQELLKNYPTYNELKRCYSLGGEVYKDKMLNNPIMYCIILKNE